MPQVKVNGLKIVWSPKLWSSKACEIKCSRGNFEKLPMYKNCKCTLHKPNVSLSFFFFLFCFLTKFVTQFQVKTMQRHNVFSIDHHWKLYTAKEALAFFERDSEDETSLLSSSSSSSEQSLMKMQFLLHQKLIRWDVY